jgi:DNA-binding SARP family transcriptional activator
LRRGRLCERLQQRARLTLVLAPAGSGKTTLLAQFASTLRDTVVWHRADRVDADPARFASRLNQAFRAGHTADHTEPSNTGTSTVQHAHLNRRTRDETATGVDELLQTIEVATTRGAVTLIVDDAQLLLASPAEDVLDRVLTQAPPALTAVLASRRALGLNLCRAEVGPVTVIGADDLRFRAWEVEQLFCDVYREPLPPDDIAMLARRTDGWAACLHLFHLSTMSRPLADRRRAVQALTGGPRFARTYLARTILDELPAQLRSFLTRTAVFEVLTARRCDHLLGTADAHRQLRLLERLEPLTTSDDGGRTFHHHEVLRRHLESALFDELGPDETRRWYATAAALLEREDALSEAVRAYVRAERWEEASRLLRADGARVISTQPGTVWDDLLPAHVVDEDPWLTLALARRLAAQGRLPAAADRYQRAEALFPDPAGRERAAMERRLVELWIDGRPHPGLHWMDRLRLAVGRRPGPAQRAGGPATAGDLLGEAVAAMLTGDLSTPAQLLSNVVQDPDGEQLMPLAARLVQAIIEAASGRARDGLADQLAADAERAGMAWVARQARVLDGLITGNGAAIGRVAQECESAGDVWGALLAQAADALRRLLAGEPSQACWQDAVRRCQALDAASLQAWLVSAAALAAAAEGAPDAAAKAKAAESFVRSARVWGAQAVTVLALAVADPAHSVNTREQARWLAVRHGLPWPATLADRLLRTEPLSPAPLALLPGATVLSRPAPVTVRCFGGFSFEIAGRHLDWRALRPRAASTLRFLSVHTPQPVHREKLIMLWPDLTAGAAVHSLQVAVSSLRSFLSPGGSSGGSSSGAKDARMVQRQGGGYLLELPPGSLADVPAFTADVQRAEAARLARDPAAERAALAAAVAGYRGELLPEEGSAEWVLAERERLRLQAAAAAQRLAELALAEGDLAACAAAAQHSVQIDRFRDRGWQLLISAYDRIGNTAEAARARHDYREVLADLGVPPRQLGLAALPASPG